jgi:methylmalonyl-CoA mutase N-terminal domain/subunit
VRGARPEGSVSTGWDVRAQHAQYDPRATNKAVLADLEGGVSSIWLRLGGDALPVESLADALNEVYLELASITLDAGAEYEAAADALLEVLAEREIPGSEVTGNVGADPIGLRARTGQAHDIAPAAALATRLAATYPKLRTIVVDGTAFHEAGGSDAQELGAAIAAGVAYLRALTDAGLDVDAAAAQLEFRLAASADQFLTIAKFRAARRLWARIMREEFGAKDPRSQMLRFHTQTAGVQLTAQQPEVNLIRVSLQALAAVLGGTQSLHTNSFDEALALPSTKAARLAIRTQQVIANESDLTATADPFAGSYAIESMTDDIEAAAESLIDRIEDMGGAAAAIERGFQKGEIEAAAYQEAREIDEGERIVVGVNKFVADGEEPYQPLRVDPSIEAVQAARLARLRQERAKEPVARAISALKTAAEGSENVLYPLRDALRADATLGEVCDALRDVWGEYQPGEI